VLFNILAPGVIEEHLAVGLSKQTSNNGEWNVAVMYAPTTTVTGLNPFDPTQTIELSMYQLEVELAYTWRF
jgi:long-chain fatty acid transport protein